MPHPLTAGDAAARYRYELSVLQAEFSLTQTLDSPVNGRIFFEQVIRDNLDIGRPDQAGLVFGRRIQCGRKRPTPGRFRTRVITDGLTPSLHVDYKNSKIKQNHKLGKALRTETTINDTGDFGVAKGLSHLPELKEIGYTASRRLLDVQRISHDPADGAAAALTVLTQPVISKAGTRTAGMPVTSPRVQALLAAICAFRLLPDGFTNRDLRTHLAPLLGLTPEDMTSGQISYDLRRLRIHGRIERIPGTHLYLPTLRDPLRPLPHPPHPRGPHPRPRRAHRPRSPRLLPATSRRPRLRRRHRRPRPARWAHRLAPGTLSQQPETTRRHQT